MFTNNHQSRSAAPPATGCLPVHVTAQKAPIAVPQKQPQQRATLSRRPRPIELCLDATDHPRVPLKAATERRHRRESRLGLRNIFGGRSKGEGKARDSKGEESKGLDAKREAAPVPAPTTAPAPVLNSPPPPPPRRLSSAGVRVSLNDIRERSHTPQPSAGREAPAVRAAPAFSHTPIDPSWPPALALRPDPMHKRSESTFRGLSAARSSLSAATWNPPPLFQAYPQAIKQDRLPACTTSAETILRMQHGHKSSLSLREGFARAPLTADLFDEPAAEDRERASVDRPRRRHRANPSASGPRVWEWTTKIYVLVTSGYLLQYAGEGAFDRLPDKILHLGKDSAAFVTDVIPGEHWVLQVSSVADEDGNTATPSSSLFSRLSFRGSERRQASDFLMVFESGESMDGWIAALRAEIEALGGKRHLSETGGPKTDEQSVQLSRRVSLRQPPRRDPKQFSRIITPSDLPPGFVQDLQNLPGPRQPPDTNDSETARSRSFDDESTVSAGSHDGRQLDALRDSTHRLSTVSSGHPTVITSAGSSPVGSPARDSLDSLQDFQTQTQPRMRPNAAAISDRRLSVQAAAHLADLRGAATQAQRPQSIFLAPGQSELSPVETVPAAGPQARRKFSVPQTSSKRHSLEPHPGEGHPPFLARMPGFRNLRRPPPSSLAINPRPLSSVQDIPSPSMAHAEKGVFQNGAAALHSMMAPTTKTPSTPPMGAPWVRPQPHRLQGLASPPLPQQRRQPLQADRRTGPGPVGSPAALAPGPLLPTRGSSLPLREAASHVTVSGSPRAFPPIGSPQSPNGEAEAHRVEARTFILPNLASPPKRTRDLQRSKSSTDISARAPQSPPCLSPPRPPTPPPPAAAAAPASYSHGKNRRSSMCSFMQRAAERTAELHKAASCASMRPDGPPPSAAMSTRSTPHSTSMPPPSNVTSDGPLLRPFQHSALVAGPTLKPSARPTQHLHSRESPFLARRSLPQLTEGPPPAPPPTCALPPLPKKLSSGALLARRRSDVAT